VEALGGPPLAGVGFAVGVERLLLAADTAAPESRAEACVIPLSDAAAVPAFQLARRLRATGMRCELEPAGRSVKSAMRRADKLGAHFAVLLGDDELRAGRATVRDMRQQRDHRCVLALDADGGAARAVLAELAAGATAGATKGATGV
jgi:histidyl-tRNA synthetase